MELVNYTPFPATAWNALDPEGREHGVLLVRACLAAQPADVPARWTLRPAQDQGGLFGEDVFFGEPGRSAVRYESDFVPFKLRTDLVLNAVARSPAGRPSQRWQCGVAVVDPDGHARHHKVLQVTGERHWRRSTLGWRLTRPAPCIEVPLRYELAYGGGYRAPANRDGTPGRWLALCERNPVGRGLLHRANPAREVAAPRIEAPNRPIADPRTVYSPEGFGFTHRSWQPRLGLAGRFDDAWLAAKHPLLPDDFDYAHYNGAHPDLIGAGGRRGYLTGRETLRLAHLLPGPALHDVALPGYRLLARRRLAQGGAVYQSLKLDTIVVDMESPRATDWRVYLSWRLRYPLDPPAMAIEAMLVKPRRGKDNHHGR